MPGSFFDTNVLIYIASADTAKADKAEALLVEGGIISVQVLNEIANVARRKMGLSWLDTRQFLEAMQAFLHVEPLTAEVHETGLDLAQRHGLSLYDAMIVASALRAECETLWSEDMQHGRALDGRLRIVNPFR
jgi:predicted nucleic acid-binding protein